MKKLLALLVAALLIVCASLALAEPVAIKALILPKFESGEMAGDFPGEAQYYYEGYCDGGFAHGAGPGGAGARREVRALP